MELDKENVLQNTKILYDYLNVNTEICKSDFIIGLGCMDSGIPKECARLYKKGYGKFIIFSGNVGKGTKGVLNITEAERFRDIAIQEGIKKEKILLEKEATNTYENYKFTKRMLNTKNFEYNDVIIVHKPYVKRRCIAIAEIELPNKNVYVTSESLNLEEFIKKSEENNTMNFEQIINEIVGEISIMLKAPKFNVMSKQDINDKVLKAYKLLLNMGYNKYVTTDEKMEGFLKRWKELGL